MRINDLPVTDAELDQFYGTPPSREELLMAIGAASSDFDDGELADVVICNFEPIADLIAAKNAEALGNYILHIRRQRIADMASRAVYGKPGFISAAQVMT